MLKQLKNNDNGIIFITVLFIIIIMITLTVGIMSLNVSQVKTTEGDVKRIQAEAAAMGAVSRMLAVQHSDTPVDNFSYSYTLNSITFVVEAT